MCGICGKVIFAYQEPERELIKSMCSTFVHRGPDGEVIYTAPHVGLGQRRLAIIDLSPTNPLISNEDESIWVVFNVEIYNFLELRKTLLEKGHLFRTGSDTEVMVHIIRLYEEYGTECLMRMRGMFAFALWDAEKGMLFAGRDRLGKKPFFYSNTTDSLIFG